LTVIVQFRVEREIAEFDLPIALIHVEGQRVFSELREITFALRACRQAHSEASKADTHRMIENENVLSSSERDKY
jgi:hypothetical protein